MTDFLNGLFAGLLDKFKAKSPTLFLVIAAIFAAIQYFILNSANVQIDAQVKQWILFAASLFLGTRTAPFLKLPTTDK